MGDVLSFLESSVTQGIIYSLVAIGLFISYRILDIADLTVDGSFTLGAAVSATFTINGKPLLGVFMAIISGMLAGCVTAFLQTKLKIHPIMAGILTMTGLYSINLRVMGKTPTLSLMRIDTIFTPFEKLLGDKNASYLVTSVILLLLVLILVIMFFKTHLGLCVRATGNNEAMVRSSSINVDVMKFIALAIANGSVALSGAVLAQYQHSANISMGTGIVIIGLASLIIGEIIVGKKHLIQNAIAVVIGSIVYWIIIALVMRADIDVSDIKLLSALIIILSLSYPVIINKIKFFRQKATGNRLAQTKGEK